MHIDLSNISAAEDLYGNSPAKYWNYKTLRMKQQWEKQPGEEVDHRENSWSTVKDRGAAAGVACDK